MHQRRMRAMLQSFVDGELPAPEQSWVEHHLASCEECARSLRCLQESDRLFIVARPEPAALSPEASYALFNRVMEEARGSRGAFRPSIQPFSWAFGAALAVTAGAAFACWGLVGGSPGAGTSPTVALRPRAGLLVTDTGRRTEPAPAVGKGNGEPRDPSGAGTPPGSGTAAKQRKATPAIEAPGGKTPADGTLARRADPLRYRYVAEGRSRSSAAGSRGHALGHEVEVGTELVSGPLPASFVDPMAASGGAPIVPGQLLVLVSPERAPSPISVTCASAETPGFARASGVRPDGSGGWLWTEATVQNECAGPERSLVILGSSAWPWEEEQDDQVWGEPEHGLGDGGDTAGPVGEPVRDPGSVSVSDSDERESADTSEPACDKDVRESANANEPACDQSSAGPGDIDADGC
jgi:Putative zinc-finger